MSRKAGRAPSILWRPSPDRLERAWMTRFQNAVGVEGGYRDLWRWSVDDLEGFWAAIWRFFDVDAAFDRVLGRREMPGTEWFPGSALSYPAHAFRDKPRDRVAIRHASETRDPGSWSWGDLADRTARIAAGLRRLGVGRGDRVAAYLPNAPETVAAFFATASLGAIWTSAAPEFGAGAVVDRFRQIEPKVLLAVDGYRYGGRVHDRRETVRRIAAEIPSLQRVVTLGYLDGSGWEAGFEASGELAFERVPFDHPLWILYSSGTTGLPKAIVQGHGGILLEQLKKMHLHLDAHPGDRVCWFTTTGWMMWNFLVGVLLTDASIVLYDGSPTHPGPDGLWDLAAGMGVTTLGTSPAYVSGCMKGGVDPGAGRDLSALQAVGVTGAPLSVDGFRWLRDRLGPDVWPFSTSGGTDVCTAFVGGVPTLPVYEGELQAPSLGCKVEAWDEAGRPLVGRVGELVITRPMPSMPLRFWGDEDGTRLRAAYFARYPGVWRHGDWIELTERDTAIIYGRSDATINRGGVRTGTSEIYRAALLEADVTQALVVDVPRGDARSWMPMFVVLREGAEAASVAERVRDRVRTECSPRHVPDEIVAVAALPRTLSGKTLEVPIKRILMGEDPEAVVSRGSLANPEALDWFVAFAASRSGAGS